MTVITAVWQYDAPELGNDTTALLYHAHCFTSLRMLLTKTASSCLSMATTESDEGWDSAPLSGARVQSQIERFAILEYSQLESDSGEAYNLRCYLWRDSKAAMRGDPRTLWGLSSFICPSLDQHVGRVKAGKDALII